MKKFIILTLPILLFLMVSDMVKAQNDMTIYNLGSVPQANYDNPALMPDTKFHIGCMPVLFIPILSSNYTSISNSGFRWDNLMHYDKTVDSIRPDTAKFFNNLAKKNYLALNQHIELLSFGFKIKQKHYINVSLTEKINFRFCYPEDMLLLSKGNSQFIGSEANFDGIGVDMMHYHELAIGYTTEINKKWTVGGRAKLLFGLANVWTYKSKASLAVDKDYFDLTPSANMIVYTSAPEALYGNNGGKFNASDYLLNFGNPGFGIDLGVNYKIDDKWSVAGSVLDFGYIFWKTGTRKYSTADTSFIFRGIDVKGLLNGNTNYSDMFKKITDSLSNIFKIDEQNQKYTSPLNPKIYLSACYQIGKRDRVSLVFRGDIYKSTIHPAFTLAYNCRFGNILDLVVSYSYMNRDFLNLGFGSSVRFGPFQIFITTDNVLAAIIPYHTKNINAHFGCNYVFYYKKSTPLFR